MSLHCTSHPATYNASGLSPRSYRSEVQSMAKDKESGQGRQPNGAAGPGQGGENVAGYFRKLHAEAPHLFAERSNDKLLKRWLADHPGQEEIPRNVKTSLANIKSVLRSKKRTRVAERAEDQQTPGQRTHMETVPTGASELEGLEHQIDECLIKATVLDREGLQDVIQHLRRARNAVVWK